jgi:3',5'-cyclic-AMP phosphodiesterase
MSAKGLDRRHFLSLLGATAASAALISPARALAAFAPPPAQDFSFIFLTDSHLEPELDGVHGTDLAMRRARTIPADFAIQGGDHVFDALGVSKARATQLFDLYGKTEQDLGLKVHHTLGNHDVFGIYPASGVGPADPSYGKKMFAERFGPTYYSFDHKGHHFIVLDSIGITPDHHYEGRIDDDQLAWLAKDLASQPVGTPILVATHMPLVTAVPYYTDPSPKFPPQMVTGGPSAIKLFEGHNVLAVLQGHTHVNEQVLWRGIPYITSGAVCGNWWHGTRLGTPEGFTVVTLSNGKLSTRYETTGFKSVDPQNT